MAITETYRWSFNVRTRNCPGTGWRHKLAAALRGLAHKIDGGTEFVLAIDSTPRLTVDQLAVCIDRGFKTMEAAVETEVRHEALEHLMRRAAPSLYTDTVK